jgi:hypothetical protein
MESALRSITKTLMQLLLQEMFELIQRKGSAKYISVFDANQGPVKPELQ